MIPLNRFTLTVGAIIAVIVLAFVGAKRWETNIRADVRDEIAAEQLAEDLAQAQADLEFQRDQSVKDQTALADKDAVIASIASRVSTTRVEIRERIADGTLANGLIAPVPMATVDHAQQLRAEVLAQP